ncbi:MAG: hypothetical protein COA79_02360 [Planctomycetota bacterium]|nr:MAG: hypothetical protein COA79_02360 [Planctomycetota bacterium]
MTIFNFTAKDNDGNVIKGDYDGKNQNEVIRHIKDRSLYVLSIDSDDDSVQKASVWTKFNRLPNKKLRHFTSQLWLPLEAGVTINLALHAIASQADDQRLSTITLDILKKIREGHSFSEALEKQNGAFPPLYIAMIRAGEASGSIPEILRNLEEFLESDADTISKLRSAIIYPFIIVNISFFVICFLVFFVLPKIMFIFKDKEHLLPMPTKILLAFKDFVVNHPLELISVIILGLFLSYYAYMSNQVRTIFDKQILRVPLFGKLTKESSISRSFSSMAVLLSAGVPILKILSIIGPISNNHVFQETWRQTAEDIKLGDALSVPMEKSNLFSLSIIQMIKTGESTGKLDIILQKISVRLLKDFNRTIADTTSLIEPILLILMGIIIGFISLAIMLPLFAISQALGH